MGDKIKFTTSPKYSLWFLIVLTVILWSLATQLLGFAWLIPYNLTNIGLWARFAATGLALYGLVWVFKIYVRSVKDARKQMEEQNKNENTDKPD